MRKGMLILLKGRDGHTLTRPIFLSFVHVTYFAKVSRMLCELLEKIPLYRTHYLLGIKKKTRIP
nr:hypothetical protein [Desulfobacterales bacterium]